MVRRLRMVSQTISGRPRVTVRAYYEGLPSMAGRGTDEGGESRRIRVKTCRVPGSTVPRPKIAACGAPPGVCVVGIFRNDAVDARRLRAR